MVAKLVFRSEGSVAKVAAKYTFSCLPGSEKKKPILFIFWWYFRYVYHKAGGYIFACLYGRGIIANGNGSTAGLARPAAHSYALRLPLLL